uniref:phosphonate C-P lyase system protein PhnG n=1 Tax=Methylobacterium sp. B1 TaxID=91459 RepID=UPI00207431A1
MTTSPRHPASEGEIGARQAVMALCAEASRTDLEAALSVLDTPAAADLRPPETGLVMASGRIGGDGRPFNLGEVSVTRAAIRLADGPAGFAYHLGRDRTKARLAAILDALWQDPDRRARGLVSDLSYPLPVTVICELLGVPREDEPRFQAWATQLATAV